MARRTRTLLPLLSGILFSAFAAPCLAAADPFGGVQPASVETLQTERAGFFSAGGQEFGFSAILETLVNGQIALVTTLTLQDNGSVSQQTVVNTELLNDSGLPANSGVVVIPVDDAASLANALAGTNVDLNGLSGKGFVIKGNSGVTAVLDSVGSNRLQNLVINTANGQNIVQNTTITLTLPADSISGFQAAGLVSGLQNAFQFSQVGH